MENGDSLIFLALNSSCTPWSHNSDSVGHSLTILYTVVFAAAGATSTMAHRARIRLGLGLGFVDIRVRVRVRVSVRVSVVYAMVYNFS